MADGDAAQSRRCVNRDRRLDPNNSSDRRYTLLPDSRSPAQPLGPQCGASASSDRELLVPPYTLGAWLGDGTSAVAQITTADPEMIMRIEAEGSRLGRPRRRSTAIRLHLPSPAVTSPRACVVCGREFVPQTSQVRTCGRTCGGRARFVSDPCRRPHVRVAVAARPALRLCRTCRDTVGTLTGPPADHRRVGKQAHSCGLPTRIGTAATGLACRSAGHRRNRDQPGRGAVLRHDERLAKDVAELIVSLGYRCQMLPSVCRDGANRRRRRSWSSSRPKTRCSGCQRKALLHKERRASKGTARSC